MPLVFLQLEQQVKTMMLSSTQKMHSQKDALYYMCFAKDQISSSKIYWHKAAEILTW